MSQRRKADGGPGRRPALRLIRAACWRGRISEFFDIFLHKAETGFIILFDDKLADRTLLVACLCGRRNNELETL
jgi:hypothetical protein